jgi:hypothetical protein
MWRWLIENGLWSSLIGAILGFLVGIGGAWLLGIRKAWHRHEHQQERIANALDTSTPGGLHDVLSAIKENTVSDGASTDG